MQVGDLVLSSIDPANSSVGIVVGMNPNGDCKVRINELVFLIHPQWLEVIS